MPLIRKKADRNFTAAELYANQGPPTEIDPSVLKTLELLEDELIRVEEQLVGFQSLMKRREDLRATLMNLRNLVGRDPNTGEVIGADTVTAPLPNPLPAVHAITFTTTGGEVPIWKIAEAVLVQSKEPLTAKQLLDSVTAFGANIEGKTPVESLRNALIRKPEIFERIEDGKFRLKRDRPEFVTGGMPPSNY